MRPKDLQAAAHQQMIASAAYFTAIWFRGNQGRGGSAWEREEHLTLKAAWEAVTKRGRDKYGRHGCVYAVTPSGMTVHVDKML